MKKKNVIVYIICLLFIFLYSFSAYSYDRESTVAYAYKYAVPEPYPVHDGFDVFGEDCANFASQCLIAGNMDLFHSYSTWPRGGNNTFKNTGGLFHWLKNNNFIEKEEERAEGLPTYREKRKWGRFLFLEIERLKD